MTNTISPPVLSAMDIPPTKGKKCSIILVLMNPRKN
jgi:hypothetical protein